MKNPKLVINQVIHGYDRGHKEISASLSLDENSRAKMLVMSDSLALLDMGEDQSYLVSYPLPDASKHVLARTWSAGKNYRPGSVWTHSLVLDYDALTLIHDLSILCDLFCKPSVANLSRYLNPIPFIASEVLSKSYGADDAALTALRQIYGPLNVNDIVVPWTGVDTSEALALALWRQMWPGLRREFGFVTCPVESPIELGSKCTLRFAKRTADSHPFEKPEDVDLYSEMLRDLPVPSVTSLRQFLRRYVIQSLNPRRLAPSLAHLHMLLRAENLELRLAHVRKFAREQELPRLMRDSLLAEMQSVTEFDQLNLIVHAFRDEVVDISLNKDLGFLCDLSGTQFSTLLASANSNFQNSLGAVIFESLVRLGEKKELLECLDESNRLKILNLRPELMYEYDFWPTSDLGRAAIISLLDKGLIDAERFLILFKNDIGSLTLECLSPNLEKLPIQIILSLLHSQDPYVGKLTAAAVVALPKVFNKVSCATMSNAGHVFESLSIAQIETQKIPEDFVGWTTLLRLLDANYSRRLESAGLVMAFLISLEAYRRGCSRLTAIFYDRVQDAILRDALPRLSKRYIERYFFEKCGVAIQGLSLSRSMASLFLENASLSCEAFLVTKRERYVKEIINECYSLFGKAILESIARDPGCNKTVAGYISKYLKKRGGGKRFSFW